jgi:hypothetical protein
MFDTPGVKADPSPPTRHRISERLLCSLKKKSRTIICMINNLRLIDFQLRQHNTHLATTHEGLYDPRPGINYPRESECNPRVSARDRDFPLRVAATKKEYDTRVQVPLPSTFFLMVLKSFLLLQARLGGSRPSVGLEWPSVPVFQSRAIVLLGTKERHNRRDVCTVYFVR